MTYIPIDKVTKLSNLVLSDEEKRVIGDKLNLTVEYVNNLQELDTDNIPATSSVSGNLNIFFEDGQENHRNLPSRVYKVDRILGL